MRAQSQPRPIMYRLTTAIMRTWSTLQRNIRVLDPCSDVSLAVMVHKSQAVVELAQDLNRVSRRLMAVRRKKPSARHVPRVSPNPSPYSYSPLSSPALFEMKTHHDLQLELGD